MSSSEQICTSKDMKASRVSATPPSIEFSTGTTPCSAARLATARKIPRMSRVGM